MSDTGVVAVSVISFFIFFIVHVFVFRRIRQEQAARWFFILAFVTSLIVALFSWISSLLFFLLSCCYFMGVFGLMATSVRIRILSEVVRARAITYHALLLRYNRNSIVRSRLARLVASGDITFTSGGTYCPGGRFTFFMAPAFLLKLMKIFYGSTQENGVNEDR
jgi:hypothetical protein